MISPSFLAFLPWLPPGFFTKLAPSCALTHEAPPFPTPLFLPAPALIDRSFTILDVIGGSFSGGMFTLDTTAAGGFESRGSWSLAENDGDVILRWTAIPEPSSVLLGALGMLLILRRKNR